MSDTNITIEKFHYNFEIFKKKLIDGTATRKDFSEIIEQELELELYKNESLVILHNIENNIQNKVKLNNKNS